MRHIYLTVALAAATSVISFAQHDRTEIVGGPLEGPMPFIGAPFSAEAITTAHHTLPNGTRLDQTTTARYFRDRAGRVRVEMLMEGVPAPKTVSERHLRLTVCPMADVYPGVPEPRCFTLDPTTYTVRNFAPLRPLSSGGGLILGMPVGGVRFVTFPRAREWIRRDPEGARGGTIKQESLGTRRVGGVEAKGQRIALTVPAGTVDNDAPFDLIDEEWESPELGLLLFGRYTDTRTGNIEYRLTNIRREDPSPDLFEIPADYTLIDPKAGGADDPWMSLSGAERWVADLNRR
jgi:hypothetical protein